MRNGLLKTGSGLAVFAVVAVLGMALVLSGCPIRADNRNVDMGGPGNIFGGTGPQPSGQVTLFITDVPADRNGRDVRVRLVTPNALCEDCDCVPATPTAQVNCASSCACEENSPWGTTCVCNDRIMRATVARREVSVVWQNVALLRGHTFYVWIAGDAGADPVQNPVTMRLTGHEFASGMNFVSWDDLQAPTP